MAKEIDVTDIRGRKIKTKVFTTRQEADDILDTLHGFKNKGKGWYGDSPGHRKAALKAKGKGAINEPIRTAKYTPPYRVDVWKERDRLIITVYDSNDKEVASWVDDEAREMFEDGFFNSKDLEESVLEYLTNRGIIPKGE